MRRGPHLALGALLLAAWAARADVLLDGNQHIGDDDTSADPNSDLLPPDPVTRLQILANPSNFHLSQATTITQLRLNNAIGLDGQVLLVIDGSNVPLQTCAPCNSCTGRLVCGTLTLDLSSPLALAAGFHTLAIDPISASNDIGFSSITLVSAQANASRNLNRRRHLGRPTDPNNDNDANDNYDITDANSPYYPDAAEGTSLSITFTLDAIQRLSEIRFYRLRDVDTNNAQVLVDGALFGNLLDSGDPLESSPTTIATSLLLLAGAHTLRVDGAIISGSDLDGFSWDDVVLRFNDVTAPGTPGFFNAVDAGQNALSGAVTTKVAGGAFTLDLYALNAAGSGVDSAYNGTANVFLLSASDNTGAVDIFGCRSSWTVAQVLPGVTFAAGYASLSATMLDAGLREARIRVTDTVTGSTGCSVDNFAVRPAGFGVISIMHGDEDSAGTTELLNNTGTSGLPRHRAGQPFTILAAALSANDVPATAYNGAPTALEGTALPPATIDADGTVENWTALGAGALRTDTARYPEVGPVQLLLRDENYAAVDADDTADAGRHIVGSLNAGRFIPDHFTFTADVTPPLLLPGCGSFTYAGQSMLFSPAPFQALITAVSASGGTTRNYDGPLYKLFVPPANYLPATTFPSVTGAVTVVNPPTPDNRLTNLGGGRTRFELQFDEIAFVRGAPVAPFTAEIYVQPGALNEADGVTFSPTAGRYPAAPDYLPFSPITSTQIRFGRLVVDNAHGSERLPLDVPLRTEYWADVLGGAGFVRNLADDCTQLPQAEIVLSGDLADGAPNPDDTSVVGYVPTFTDGRNVLRLAAPNDSGQAEVQPDLTGALLPWLKLDADGDASYDDDPLGVATFGIARDQDRRIYQREVIGY